MVLWMTNRTFKEIFLRFFGERFDISIQRDSISQFVLKWGSSHHLQHIHTWTNGAIVYIYYFVSNLACRGEDATLKRSTLCLHLLRNHMNKWCNKWPFSIQVPQLMTSLCCRLWFMMYVYPQGFGQAPSRDKTPPPSDFNGFVQRFELLVLRVCAGKSWYEFFQQVDFVVHEGGGG